MPTTEKRFNLARAVRSAASARGGVALDYMDSDEAEVSEGLSRRFDPGANRPPGGFWTPLSAFAPRSRAADTSNWSGAVATMRAPLGSAADLLRSKALLGLLGAEFASFWGGNVPLAVPTKTTGAAAGWLAEGEALALSTPVIVGDDDPTPRTVAAGVNVTRKLWASVEDQVLDDYLADELGKAIGAAVDRAAFVGDGVKEPLGLFNDPDVPAASIGANGGPLTRALLAGAMRVVHEANGDSPATARMAWAGNPSVEAKLRLTDGGMGDGALWSDADRILGKPAAAATSIPKTYAKGTGTGLSGLIYGNWGDLLINHAPAVFIQSNPFTLDTSGAVRVVAFLEVKSLPRHPQSFIRFVDVQTT